MAYDILKLSFLVCCLSWTLCEYACPKGCFLILLASKITICAVWWLARIVVLASHNSCSMFVCIFRSTSKPGNCSVLTFCFFITPFRCRIIKFFTSSILIYEASTSHMHIKWRLCCSKKIKVLDEEVLGFSGSCLCYVHFFVLSH